MNIQKLVVIFSVAGMMFAGPLLHADECMEGDCDNGFGIGFTEDNKVYEGEWKDGVPHGLGELAVSKEKVVRGRWENGELVEELPLKEKEKLQKDQKK